MFFIQKLKLNIFFILLSIFVIPDHLHASNLDFSDSIVTKIQQATQVFQTPSVYSHATSSVPVRQLASVQSSTNSFTNFVRNVYCGTISFIGMQCLEPVVESLVDNSSESISIQSTSTTQIQNTSEDFAPKEFATVPQTQSFESIKTNTFIPQTQTQVIERILAPIGQTTVTGVSYAVLEARLILLKQEILGSKTSATTIISGGGGGVSPRSITNLRDSLQTQIDELGQISLTDIGGFTTTDLTEGTNLYFTDSRARSALSSDMAAINYSTSTGVFSLASGYTIPTQFQLDNKQELIATGTIAQYFRGDLSLATFPTSVSQFTNDANFVSNLSTFNTDDLSEGGNLYYTQSRFDTAFSLKSTSNLTEGTNLYFTDTRARSAFSNTVTGLTYTSGTGVFSLAADYFIPTTANLSGTNTGDQIITLTGALTGSGTTTFSTQLGSFTKAELNTALSDGTSLFSGDNISQLVNDSGYLTSISGLNISELNNNSNFISNISTFSTDDLTQGVTNLYSQWATSGSSISYMGGNVGIGTTNPGAPLDIGGYGTPMTIGTLTTPKLLLASSDNQISGIQMKNTSTGATADTRFIISDTTDNYLAFALPGTGNNQPSLFGKARATTAFIFNTGGTTRDIAIGTIGSNSLTFGTNNTARMMIDSSGNVGIGTTSPNSKLSVAGNASITENLGINIDPTTNNRLYVRETSNVANNQVVALFENTGSDQARIVLRTNQDTAPGNRLIGSQFSTTGSVFSFQDYEARNFAIRTGSNVGSNSQVFYITNTGRTAFGNFTDPGSTVSVSGSMSIGSAYRTVSAPTNGLIVEGNVGIGTNAPHRSLTLQGTSAGSIFTGLSLNNFSTSNNSGARIAFTISTAPDANNELASITAIRTNAGSVQNTDLIFSTTQSSAFRDLERMRITGAGNVGIGTTNPLAQFVVNGASANQGQVGISVNNTNANGYSVFRIGTETPNAVGMAIHQFGSGYSGSGTYTSNATTFSAFESGGMILHANSSGAPIRFFTNGSAAGNERMRIVSNGNIGIGTTNPLHKLDVAGTGYFASSSVPLYARTTGGSGLQAVFGDSTYNKKWIRIRDASTTGVDFGLSDDNTLHNNGLFLIRAGLSKGFAIALNTANQFDAVTSSDIKFLITDAGNVGIGVNAPSQKLHVAGNARFESVGSGAYAFDLNLTSDGTLTTSASDRRLKENIQTLDASSTLDKLLQLNASTFDWKSNGAHDIGLIAQEVEEIFPELVFTNPTDGFKGINYSRLPTLLIASIQEIVRTIREFATLMQTKLLRADKIETQELCIDGLCITKDQLQNILNGSGTSGTSDTSGSGSSSDETTTSNGDSSGAPTDDGTGTADTPEADTGTETNPETETTDTGTESDSTSGTDSTPVTDTEPVSTPEPELEPEPEPEPVLEQTSESES